MKRTETISFKIKDKIIGGQNKVLIQSMSTYLPRDLDNIIKQLKDLEKAGADILRFAVKGDEDIINIPLIKKEISIPLVADIHFNYELGIKAIEAGVDKIRFNPGNIGCDSNLKKLIDKAIEYDIPVRIGVNSGSIEKEYLERNDLTNVEKCVLSLKKYVLKAEELGLKKIVLSIKLSNPIDAIEAYERISKEFRYPLHIGLTESGIGTDAIIKSTSTLAPLLKEGLGDTIRVSLTGDPIQEVIVAKEILKSLNLLDGPDLISCPTCGRTEVNLEIYANILKDYLHTINKKIRVACMGCMVNGPGEAKDADIGIAFLGKTGVIFKKDQIIEKGEPMEMINKLKSIIEEM